MLTLRPKGSSSAHSNAIVSGDKERLRWYLSSVLKVSVQVLCTVFALLNVAGWFRRRRALRFRAWEHSFLYFTSLMALATRVRESSTEWSARRLNPQSTLINTAIGRK